VAVARESQYSLLKQRRFGPFFFTQFLGAFNDNFFKNSLLILIAFQIAGFGGLSTNSRGCCGPKFLLLLVRRSLRRP
jgi:hypothetical protein